ncbi:glycosyltransferase family protein [Bacillus spizizenii ATCC 6633 = JCM 2499]|uniref:Glycosyl transferase family protein n=1 Tax=Bacillus spizizenii (strain ATCC 23059 / NRRL B-14472 / W23) TaxID=655816 RepID=E0TYW2_BACSH|nr:glycosyltransferase family protein [Bacillus spizizenii]QCJ17245.1 glycosyltransferase [Bacillus subtilis]ADM38069.1 glycosyl transferase family protein [Bacillus spizizenii str. W23]AJW87389.1 glycosyltransferase [Bacillus spizizenii]EFG93211.1 glycosyl transferase family protein [Bacillus spizizenii ATCC 6633 = JCM 2499]KFK80239.1 glycosyltransferase like family protein [Bacillus spizizenii]
MKQHVNENSICFITCVNDDTLYDLCLRHIQSLSVPPHMKVELIDIRKADSMASGYQAAMQDSDAKYKVYVHQDTFIINRSFIYDILYVFQQNDELGMIGVIGAEEVPQSGIWWEASKKAGKVIEYRSTYSYLSFDEINETVKTVQALDGLLLATQYDLPWQKEIFDGWHLYDTSQCFEFRKKGYLVGIPYQKEPWVIHACGNEFDQIEYSHYLEVFVREYLS